MKHREQQSKTNKEAFEKYQSLIRPKCRLALDTNCLFFLRNEKYSLDTTILLDGPWAGIPVGHAETVNPKRTVLQEQETAALNALCQLALDETLDFVMLPSIRKEMKGTAFAPIHGVERLDRGIHYLEPEIQCERMKFALSYVVRGSEERLDDDCIADVGKFDALIKHASGEGQRLDTWHFIQAELSGIDVFLSADKKFLGAFRQVEPTLRKRGVRTLLMKPTEFCEKAKIAPIVPPPANPRAARGGPPAY